ncbi:MAG: hypothetical protein B6I20_01535 [Bacteroidetes bacterium 4572_117]|nr:MAG: hypothetical protein B6I20_01535 [Bacteroidetes bacterium 4572_117]
MKNLITILLLSIVLFACEKTVTIKIPDNGRKLTINSFFQQDSSFSVSLTKSRYIMDGKYEFDNVENADINLFENDNLIEKLGETNPGVYKSNFIPTENNNYRIEVSSTDFPMAQAQSFMPEKTEIIDISTSESFDEYGNPGTAFKVKFKDKPNIDSYYFVNVNKRINFSYYDEDEGTDVESTYTQAEDIYSEDPIVFQEDWGLTAGLLVSGELINGREYTLSFETSGYYYYDGHEPDNESNTTYFVYLHSISKDYYLYYKSLSKHKEAQDEFFMEPVQVYNNIENGFGIFAGFSTAVDSVKVE